MKNISFIETPPYVQYQNETHKSTYNELISTPTFYEIKQENNENLINTIKNGIILGDCGKLIDLFC